MKFIFNLLRLIACNYFYLSFDTQKARITEFLKKYQSTFYKLFKKIKKKIKLNERMNEIYIYFVVYNCL